MTKEKLQLRSCSLKSKVMKKLSQTIALGTVVIFYKYDCEATKKKFFFLKLL